MSSFSPTQCVIEDPSYKQLNCVFPLRFVSVVRSVFFSPSLPFVSYGFLRPPSPVRDISSCCWSTMTQLSQAKNNAQHCAESKPKPTNDGESKPAATDEPSPCGATELRTAVELWNVEGDPNSDLYADLPPLLPPSSEPSVSPVSLSSPVRNSVPELSQERAPVSLSSQERTPVGSCSKV